MVHVEKRLSHDASGHDWFHTRRVWEMAKFLQSKEGGEAEVIEIAALLHCAAEHDLRSVHSEKMRTYTLMGILDVLDVDGAKREKIIDIVQWSHYKGGETEKPQTIEGKIVQDANFLETVGAIGVARAFTAGGYLGRLIHNPAIKPMVKLTNELYQKRKREGTSVNYLFEKPLQIVTLLNTQTAKKIGESRLKFTKLFLSEFFKEWEGNDKV
ncbi:MAG: phosphohydrolase [Candidatus Taylorbacteria bacterium]|nr:phosphohydrolase [Candidatus Taylorbacteria bacterium]